MNRLGRAVSATLLLLAGAGLLAPPAAAGGVVIVVGRDAPTLQGAIAAAGDGDVVEVPEGRWDGPVRIDSRITVRGRGGVVDGGGEGTVIVVAAAGAVVEDLKVRGSGAKLGAPDCCIYVEPGATGATLRDNDLTDCGFGIWIHETKKARIVGNTVKGRTETRVSDRGNGIQLFDATELVVRDNVVTGARDGIYVSATEDSLIETNRTEDQRYGVHYMYSYRNTLRGNVSKRNLGGFALMESRDLVVVDNVAEDNERHGLLFRDAQDSEIRGNRLVRNGQGMFFFSSTDNVIEDNRIVHNDIGVKVWAGSYRNRVSRNAFVGNRQQVFFVGSEDLEWGVDAPGNLWSDYAGWDQDGDGYGDRPYRVDSFTASLTHRHPSAVYLLRSPVLELLSHLESRLPVLRVPTVVDRKPAMGEEMP